MSLWEVFAEGGERNEKKKKKKMEQRTIRLQQNQNNKTKKKNQKITKPFLGVLSVFNPFTKEFGGNFLPSFCIKRRLLRGVTTVSMVKREREREGVGGVERERWKMPVDSFF